MCCDCSWFGTCDKSGNKNISHGRRSRGWLKEKSQLLSLRNNQVILSFLYKPFQAWNSLRKNQNAWLWNWNEATKSVFVKGEVQSWYSLAFCLQHRMFWRRGSCCQLITEQYPWESVVIMPHSKKKNPQLKVFYRFKIILVVFYLKHQIWLDQH